MDRLTPASIQEKYVLARDWKYIGTQDNLVFYRRHGQVETLHLPGIEENDGENPIDTPVTVLIDDPPDDPVDTP